MYGGWSVRVGGKIWPTDQPSIRMLLAQQWTYGHVMGRAAPSTFMDDKHTLAFTRQLAQLKVNYSEFLVYGRLMHPPTLTAVASAAAAGGGSLRDMKWSVGYPAGKFCNSPVVIGQVWMASNGSLGVALANPSNESQAVNVSLRVDGHTHNIIRPKGAVLVDRSRRYTVDESHLTLLRSLPALSAAIVRIDPAGQ